MAGYSVFLDFPRLVTPRVADKWLPRFSCTLEVDCIRGREGKELCWRSGQRNERKNAGSAGNEADDIAFHDATIQCICRSRASYYDLHYYFPLNIYYSYLALKQDRNYRIYQENIFPHLIRFSLSLSLQYWFILFIYLNIIHGEYFFKWWITFLI